MSTSLKRYLPHTSYHSTVPLGDGPLSCPLCQEFILMCYSLASCPLPGGWRLIRAPGWLETHQSPHGQVVDWLTFQYSYFILCRETNSLSWSTNKCIQAICSWGEIVWAAQAGPIDKRVCVCPSLPKILCPAPASIKGYRAKYTHIVVCVCGIVLHALPWKARESHLPSLSPGSVCVILPRPVVN